MSLWACGGGPKIDKIVEQQPWAVLPGDAGVVFGFRPKDVAGNPLVGQLRAALGAQDAPLPYTRTISSLGIDAQTQVQNGCWAMYSSGPVQQRTINWVITLVGDVGEEKVLGQLQSPEDPRLQAAVESKSFQNTTFYAVSRGAAVSSAKVYLAFLAPNVMFAANSESLAQHGIAVWRGKADSLLEDESFAPLLKLADTNAPVWCAGKAEGTLTMVQLVAESGILGLGPSENMGRGVQYYYGALHLTPEAIDLQAVFECDNANAASKQKTNYETYAQARADALARTLLGGPAAMQLYDGLSMAAQDSQILVKYQLTKSQLETLLPKIQQARQQQENLKNLLRQQMEQGGAPEAPPGIEEAPAPGETPPGAQTPEDESSPGAPPAPKQAPAP